MTVLLRSVQETSEQKKFSYVKIRSIGTDGEEPTFVGGYEELRVVISRIRSRPAPEIVIADFDLIVTHKLTIVGLCGYLKASRVAVRSIEQRNHLGRGSRRASVHWWRRMMTSLCPYSDLILSCSMTMSTNLMMNN